MSVQTTDSDTQILKAICDNPKINRLNLLKLSEPTKHYALQTAKYYLKSATTNNPPYKSRAKMFINMLQDTYLPFEPRLNFFTNTDNSCYMDSVVFALFAIPNKYIDTQIINTNIARYSTNTCNKNDRFQDIINRASIQSEIKLFIHFIRNGGYYENNINKFRDLFRLCPHQDNFYDKGMKDAGEFLTYLIGMFPTNTTRIVETTSVSNDGQIFTDYQQNVITDASIAVSIAPTILKDGTVIPVSRFIDYNYIEYLGEQNALKRRDATYTYVKKRHTIISADYLVFKFDRHVTTDTGHTRVNLYKILPEQTLIFRDKFLTLSSIVLWKHFHNTCLFKNGDKWYYYNDSQGIEFVGDYTSLFTQQHFPSPITNGVLYFYV